jgi:signal recognition particle receptor subunit beta
MPIINYKSRTISCKIVYFGPSLGGKTTSIKSIHARTPEDHRGALQTIQTEGDRTLFFDFFSLDLADIGGMHVRFQIYGVPGEPFYRATRKMVLTGADGIIFVADSASHRLADNVASYNDLKELLKEHGYHYDEIPLVMQYNKRDLEDKKTVDELEFYINERKVPAFESTAIEDQGVREPFKEVCRQVVDKLNRDLMGVGTSARRGSETPENDTADDSMEE